MVKNPPASIGDTGGFDSWVGKISWRRKWQPTPVFLPEDSQGSGDCWAAVHRVAKNQTQPKQLSTNTTHILTAWVHSLHKIFQPISFLLDCENFPCH